LLLRESNFGPTNTQVDLSIFFKVELALLDFYCSVEKMDHSTELNKEEISNQYIESNERTSGPEVGADWVKSRYYPRVSLRLLSSSHPFFISRNPLTTC
jgi:hypothetical protein